MAGDFAQPLAERSSAAARLLTLETFLYGDANRFGHGLPGESRKPSFELTGSLVLDVEGHGSTINENFDLSTILRVYRQ
jgi:hypothetical protein